MNRVRARIIVRGAVQGVGFRPFVYRLANELQLAGWVSNSAQGVVIEIEGAQALVRECLVRLEKEKPPLASVYSLESSFLDELGYSGFEIRESADTGEKTAIVLPDIATCADCLREIFDPNNRRFRYPFTNCTNCGPRFSIIEALPYDRANTSMKKFAMCSDCEREYRDPIDRRFHAQPNACPRCGPQLQLWDDSGTIVSERDEALRGGAEAVRAGKILALKGIGGFQLIVDAGNEAVVARLRERKHREEKPFALMFPSLDSVKNFCDVSELEERLLLSPESPIVLLRARSEIAPSVAPRNPNLGAMLPYTPLHHLLMRELNAPIVATSGNLSDEPICIDERDALERLRGIADCFLVHDRPIVRHVDDSITRVMSGRELVLRRARGYAPLPIRLKTEFRSTLAVGAHLKNAVALSIGKNVFVSQHIGDLETEQAYRAFKSATKDLPRLYDVKPEIIACDMHPEYLSTKYALGLGSAGCQPAAFGSLPDASAQEDSRQAAANGRLAARAPQTLVRVQHHWAHIAACMAENEIEAPALGVAWDGTGFGLDETIWGGEFLLANGASFTRVAHLRQFRLPGGEAAIKQPRRVALGLLHEIFGDELWLRHDLLTAFSQNETSLLRQLLEKQINAPLTSSAGRLFDAVASIIGLRQRTNFEGQAAMELEFSLRSQSDDAYHFELRDGSPTVVDWQPAIMELLNDLKANVPVEFISAKFHNMLAETIVAVARKIGEPKVVLSGGCFQNRYLTERTIDRLRAENFRPYWHQRVPPNDGGIALGQIVAANWARDARR